MVETTLWWIFLFACVFAFFFSYGIVEEVIRKWLRDRQTRKPKLTPRVVDISPDPKGNGHSDFVRH